jgi:hypothetical protein
MDDTGHDLMITEPQQVADAVPPWRPTTPPSRCF